MDKTLLIYNGDYKKQAPLKFEEILDMDISSVYEIFHSYRYRKNTGTFLMTDSLAKNLDAEWVRAFDIDRIKESKATSIVTNAFHCISPKFYFDKLYWKQLLDTDKKIVPMTCGFRYHENGDFYLSKDIVYVLKAISERNEIGCRGVKSAEILDSYNIKNLRVVGCHSIFYNWDKFKPIKKSNELKRINFNFNQNYTDYFESHLDFCNKSLKVYKYFLEIYRKKKVAVDFTLQTEFFKELTSISNFINFSEVKDFYKECGRYFFSVDDWIDGLKNDDFSIGTQFHGNVASIVAGVAALVIAIDDRMVELCEYHSIPYITVEEFNTERTLKEYYDFTDYTKFNLAYKKKLGNYVDYCKKNGVLLKTEVE